jgi:hypothetical protein
MLVENEFIRTEARLETDPRLLAAVSAIIEHAAAHVGMGDARCHALMAATERACREAWPASNGREPRVEVICDQYADRVEVAIQGPGATPPEVEGTLKDLQKRVDRVTTENRNGSLRIVIVEYLSARQ